MDLPLLADTFGMARIWTCVDCPATGIQERGYLRKRCDDCKRAVKRERFRDHYAKNADRVLANQKKHRTENAEAISARLRAKRRENSPEGILYLLEAVGTDTYKIGFSVNEKTLEKRIVHCQTGNAFEIRLLATCRGTMMDEADLHRELASSRMFGEWFSLTPDLRRVVRREFGHTIRKRKSAPKAA